MKVNNGIIIDGVLHELCVGICDECSLQNECDDSSEIICNIAYNNPNMDQRFVCRGKVTDNVSVEKATEVLSSVLENWAHGGDADCIIAEFEEKLMKTK